MCLYRHCADGKGGVGTINTPETVYDPAIVCDASGAALTLSLVFD